MSKMPKRFGRAIAAKIIAGFRAHVDRHPFAHYEGKWSTLVTLLLLFQ